MAGSLLSRSDRRCKLKSLHRLRLATLLYASAIVCLAISRSAVAQLDTKPALNLAAAQGIIAAAEKAASDAHVAVVIAVVDDGGNLMALARMDKAHLGSVEIAERKARTSAFYNVPTKVLADGLAAGTAALQKLDILPFAGGIPLMVHGQQVGSVGVSGCDTDTQDAKMAQAGVDWFTEKYVK
jgi:glc operon protein GlcG